MLGDSMVKIATVAGWTGISNVQDAVSRFLKVGLLGLIIYSPSVLIFIVNATLAYPLIYARKPLLASRLGNYCYELYCIYISAVVEILYGFKIKVYGDTIGADDWSLILFNHRSMLDFITVNNCISRGRPMRRVKATMKESLKFLPGFGWGLQLNSQLFFSRDWTKDSVHLENLLEFNMAEAQHPRSMYIFPEGTRLNPATLKSSLKFARREGLSEYQHVLQPRTTGLAFFIQKYREHGRLDAIYDVTVAYVGNASSHTVGLFTKGLPQEVHFLVKRYDGKEIPDTPSEIRDWCRGVWTEKDKNMATFSKSGSFPNENISFEDGTFLSLVLSGYYGACLVMVLSCTVLYFYLLTTSWLVLIHAVVIVTVHIVGMWMFGGWEKLLCTIYKEQVDHAKAD